MNEVKTELTIYFKVNSGTLAAIFFLIMVNEP